MNLQVRVLSYCLDSGGKKKKNSPMADPVIWICRMAVRQASGRGQGWPLLVPSASCIARSVPCLEIPKCCIKYAKS